VPAAPRLHERLAAEARAGDGGAGRHALTLLALAGLPPAGADDGERLARLILREEEAEGRELLATAAAVRLDSEACGRLLTELGREDRLDADAKPLLVRFLERPGASDAALDPILGAHCTVDQTLLRVTLPWLSRDGLARALSDADLDHDDTRAVLGAHPELGPALAAAWPRLDLSDRVRAKGLHPLWTELAAREADPWLAAAQSPPDLHPDAPLRACAEAELERLALEDPDPQRRHRAAALLADHRGGATYRDAAGVLVPYRILDDPWR
jgi:hypothetical protein